MVAALSTCGAAGSKECPPAARCVGPCGSAHVGQGRLGHHVPGVGESAAAQFLGRIMSLALVSVAIYTSAGLPLFWVAQLMLPFGQLVAMLSLGMSVGRFRPVWKWREIGGLAKETLPISYILIVIVTWFALLFLTRVVKVCEITSLLRGRRGDPAG